MTRALLSSTQKCAVGLLGLTGKKLLLCLCLIQLRSGVIWCCPELVLMKTELWPETEP